MKIECKRCNKLVDDSKICMIQLIGVYSSYCDYYCLECYAWEKNPKRRWWQ